MMCDSRAALSSNPVSHTVDHLSPTNTSTAPWWVGNEVPSFIRAEKMINV